jgi:hypothetical protein
LSPSLLVLLTNFGELDFDIEDKNVAKYLGIKLATLRNRLKNVY